MPKPPPLPSSRKRSGCGPLAGIIMALVIGWIGGRVTAPTTHTSSIPAAAVPLPAAAVPLPAAPIPDTTKIPEATPPPAPALPLPAKESATLSTDANRIIGKIVGVADGDTVTLLSPDREQIKIRLEGIDAPENSQEYGAKSKQALSALVHAKTATATVTGKDRYGRFVAWLDVEGVSINRRMVSDGWAWQYLKYNNDPAIARLQETARASKAGLWASPNKPMPPWEFRVLGKASQPDIPAVSSTSGTTPQTSEQRTETSSGAKYWINSNGVRHNSRCRWYGNTKRGHYSSAEEGRGCGICGG